jgi:hypothetical protein
MIFRKNTARLTPANGIIETAFAQIPPRRRVVCAWRRDEATGRLKMVWKMVGEDYRGIRR